MAVRRSVPGISPGDCIAEFAGVRAASDTGDFVIGPTVVPGFLNVAGIQSPGLTAAPAIADLVTDLLRDQGLDLREKADLVAPAPRPRRSETSTGRPSGRGPTPIPAFGRRRLPV